MNNKQNSVFKSIVLETFISYNYFTEKNVLLSFDSEKHYLCTYHLHLKFGLWISSKKNVKIHSCCNR